MRLFSPFKVLVALVFVVSALRIAYVVTGAAPSAAAEFLTPFCLGLAFILWVVEDARVRRRVPCYDFAFLVAVFFPVSVLWYVVWSRGWWGLVTLVAIFGLMILPQLSAVVAWVLMYDVG